MTTTATELDVRALTEADDPAVIELLGVALGGGPTGGRTAEFFRWKHRLKPFGSSPGLVAVHGGRIVGVRLFMRWALQADGQPVKALRAVDTATDPAFQGKGIFRSLTLGLLDQLDASGEVDLVFNTPNASSRPGYLKMGWQPVGTLPVRLAPVRPLRFLRGGRAASGATAGAKKPAATATGKALPSCPLPSAVSVLAERHREVEELVAAGASTHRFHTPLSMEYLSWRYGSAPGLDYRAVAIDSGGTLSGLAFGRLRQRGPLAEFTLADILVADGDRRSAGRLLRAARRSGADYVAAHTSTGTEVERAASAAGYLRVPGNGIGLVANPRRPIAASAVEPAAWRLSLGDLEVF